MEQRLYSLTETAIILGRSRVTIHRWIKAGALRVVRPGGPASAPMVTSEEIERVTQSPGVSHEHP